MKNLKFNSIGMLLIAVLLSVNTNIFAQRGNGNGQGYGQFNENNQGYFCNNIPNLTADQETKIEKLRTAHWKEQQNNRNQLAEKRARLQTLRSEDNADMKTINKTVDEISVIQTSMQKNREQHFQDVRILLTDDQKVYFDNFDGSRGYGHGSCTGDDWGKGKRSERRNGCCGRNW